MAADKPVQGSDRLGEIARRIYSRTPLLSLEDIRAALEALVRDAVSAVLDDAHECPDGCPFDHKGAALRRYGLEE